MNRFLQQLGTTRSLLCKRIGLSVVLALPTASVAYAAPGDQSSSGAPILPNLSSDINVNPSPDPMYASAAPAPLSHAAPSGALGSVAPVTAAPSSALGGAPGWYTPYTWKGLHINLPGPENTVDLNLGGLRQTLASYGIGYNGYGSGTFYSNVLHSEHNTGNAQQYNGQRPTGLSNDFFTLTYDLRRFGIPDGQLIVSGGFVFASWNPGGPNEAHVGELAYYQTAFHKLIEFKIGLIGNNFEFAGPNVAGNIAGGIFGPTGSLLYQSGETGLAYPTYGANLTIHPDKHFYDKIGVARATDPDGVVGEVSINPTGLRGSVANSGVWVINEVGYLRPPALETPQTWVRGGGIYSSSRFNDYDDGGRATGNYTLYLLADRQLLQIGSGKAEAYRGFYGGFSAEYAPSSINRFSQYYEVRLYGLGVIPHHKKDQVSLIGTDTFFSRNLTASAFAAGQLAHHDSKSITLSYSAYAFHGLYLNAGVSYVNNPTSVTYRSNTGSALNMITGFAFFF